MEKRHLSSVEDLPPSTLDEVVSFVDALRLKAAAKLDQEGISFVVTPGTVRLDSADGKEGVVEKRGLTITLYSEKHQHGPNPNFRKAKFTTRIMGGNGEISGPATSFALTENNITGERKISHIHVISSPQGNREVIGDSCDEAQIAILLQWLRNFVPKNS